MKYILLSKVDITYINKRTVETHGGNYVPPDNYLHEENLDYLVDAVNSRMFNQELYPEISDKAAVYCFNIICNHIFTDGNKRTGLGSALAFLKLNSFRLNKDFRHKEIEEFILKIASGNSSLEECKEWFEKNITPLK
jgi:death on curing protein